MYSNQKESNENAASVELARATRAFESADYQNAISLLSNLVETYGGTRSGKLGIFYLAASFYNTDDFQSAEENYKKFTSSFKGERHLLASAMTGMAACMEQKGQYIESAEQYQKTVEKYGDHIFAARLLLRAARCYTLADDPERADQIYEKIINDYPDARERDEALTLKAML
jgi:TolA-binding protein